MSGWVNAFNSQVVMITGAAGGIGQVVTEYFSRIGGADLFLFDHPRKRKMLKEIKDRMSKTGFVEVFGVDITNFSELRNAVNQLVKNQRQFRRRIDVLVNVAGVLPVPTPLVKMRPATIKKVVDVNLLGTLNCCQAVLPFMRKEGYGRIVNVSSVSAHVADPGNIIYGISKSAIERLTSGLAIEAPFNKDGEPFNITVNAVAPGIVETPMTADISEKALVEYLKRTAIKRRIQPEEVADAVYFLAKTSSAINGVILPVDGGYLAS